MASRNATQTDSFENFSNKNNTKVIPMLRRRSFDMMTSSKNHSSNKNKIGYISEPNDYFLHENDLTVSASEMSDFNTNNSNALSDSNIIEIKNKNKNSNKVMHNINYIGIGHDTQLQTDSEILAINKNQNILCKKNIGLTMNQLTKELIKQPKYLHLTFHGEYNSNTNIPVVKFDSIPILPQLLTNNKTFLYKKRTQKYYRDYVAAIARIFELELIKFVSQPVNKLTNEPLQNGLKYICIGSEGIFENVPKLKQLLDNIAKYRFQCPYVHYRNRKFMAIWYGVWKQDPMSGQTVMIQPPNKWLLDEYKLENICKNRQIDAIVRLIEKQYKRIAANNPNLMNINSNCQMYSWSVMNHAINQVIPQEVWQFLNSDESNMDMKDSSCDDELYDSFSRTFELTVTPMEQTYENISKIKKLKAKQTDSEQKILEQRICAVMEEVLKNIRQDEMASNGLEYISPWSPAPNLLNYKILRFSNETAISCTKTKVIAQMQRKYKNKYSIRFNQLSAASKFNQHTPSHYLCGYVPLNAEKKYELDMKNGTDEISTIIREKLISKDKCGIKVLLLLGCHSYKLAQIFCPYIENIVCVHPHTEIDDDICVKFSKYFYNELAEIDDNKTKIKYVVMKAFNNAMNKLHKLYKQNTACQFHDQSIHSNIDNSIPTLMVVRIDRDKHFELMQYVNHRLMDEKNNFGLNCQKKYNTVHDISEPVALLYRQSSRGGQNMPDDVECAEIYDTNNRKSMSIDSSSNSLSLKQCFDDALDEFEDSAMVDIESSDYGVSWEYIETKNDLNFSYSIIKCDNEKIKIRVEQILKGKKKQELIAINRKFTNTKNIYPNKNTFLTQTEDDVNYVDLRWDVRDLPKCQCRMNVPHRVEDELILLINGKHIDRNIKVPTNKTYHKRSASLPVGSGYYNINKVKLIDCASDISDDTSLVFKPKKLESIPSEDTEAEDSRSYSGN